MKAKFRNVKVMLDEEVARWARIEAARQDTSVSRLLSAILRERMLQDEAYKKSMRRALARKPFLKAGGPHLSRDEAHHRPRLR
jgi:hypothetical protein